MLSVSVVSTGLSEREVMFMRKRHGLSRGRSKRMFTKSAQSVHPFNSGVMTGPGGPMRGGIRL